MKTTKLKTITLAIAACMVVSVAVFPVNAGGMLPVVNIKDDEELVFFPDYAYVDPRSKLVRIRVHAWAFEPETDSVKRKAFLALLKKQMNMADSDETTKLFEERCMHFMVDQQRGKVVTVKIGNDVYNAGATDSNGHTERAQCLPLQMFNPIVAEARGGKEDSAVWFDVSTSARTNPSRVFTARTRFIPYEGVSVVTDIDDTIKISQVSDKKILLENTFIKPYKDVPGMAQLYRTWSERGAEFHYLSASPWQLYTPISGFLKSAGFPDGVYKMKIFGFPVNFTALFDQPEKIKTPYLTMVLKDFPGRKFIFVGDSGEKDPEIYGAAARANPGRGIRVFIRNVTGETRDSARMKEAFKGIPDDAWTLFTDASELKSISF
jgi:phosphatidate phosphatase APP1